MADADHQYGYYDETAPEDDQPIVSVSIACRLYAAPVEAKLPLYCQQRILIDGNRTDSWP